MAVATLALGAGSAVANYAAQGSAAKQQAKYQNNRYTQVATNAIASYRTGINQLLIRDSQETSAASRDSMTARKTVKGQQATVRNLVSSAGLGGNTVSTLLREFDSLEADNQFVIDRNLKNRQSQIRAEMEGLRTTAQNQINSAEPQPVNQPSALALALNVGSAGLQAANTWKAWQPPK